MTIAFHFFKAVLFYSFLIFDPKPMLSSIFFFMPLQLKYLLSLNGPGPDAQWEQSTFGKKHLLELMQCTFY